MIGAYLELGFDHILDPKGYDHILFIIALCAIYSLKEWKKIVMLVTAFTIGHSLTLALSALDVVKVNADIVELLIMLSILATCIYNIIQVKFSFDKIYFHYSVALGFGLIHGLGFSNFFKAMLGRSEEIIWPLFSFNVGVELGQLIIVLAILLVSYLLVDLMKIKKELYTIIVSSGIFLWVISMMIG